MAAIHRRVACPRPAHIRRARSRSQARRCAGRERVQRRLAPRGRGFAGQGFAGGVQRRAVRLLRGIQKQGFGPSSAEGWPDHADDRAEIGRRLPLCDERPRGRALSGRCARGRPHPLHRGCAPVVSLAAGLCGGAGGWVRARDDCFGAPRVWRDFRRRQPAVQDAGWRRGQADGRAGGGRGAGLCPSEREESRYGRGRAAADRPRDWHWQHQVHGAVVQPHLGLRVRLGQDAGPRRQHRSVHALFVRPHQEHVPPRWRG